MYIYYIKPNSLYFLFILKNITILKIILNKSCKYIYIYIYIYIIDVNGVCYMLEFSFPKTYEQHYIWKPVQLITTIHINTSYPSLRKTQAFRNPV